MLAFEVTKFTQIVNANDSQKDYNAPLATMGSDDAQGQTPGSATEFGTSNWNYHGYFVVNRPR